MARQYYYRQVIRNSYLGKSKEVKGRTKGEMEAKAAEQLARWASEEQRQRERDEKRQTIALGKERAEFMNRELAEERAKIGSMVGEAAKLDFAKAWRKTYEKKFFSRTFSYPPAPTYDDAVRWVGGIPEKTLFESFSKKKREARESKEREAADALREMTKFYEAKRSSEEEKFREEEKARADSIAAGNKLAEEKLSASIDDADLFEDFLCDAVDIIASQLFHDPEIEVTVSTGLKAVQFDISVAGPEGLSTVKEYRYVQSRNEITETKLKKSDAVALYDSYVFSSVVSVLAMCVEVLVDKGVEIVSVNAWVDGVDPKTGHDFRSCIVSVQASDTDLKEIAFSKVDPKECVRGLKGLYAGSLTSLAPVKPVMNLNREDSRFIESRDVLAEMDPTQNLAIMDWQDFEYLVRQLFENIFKTSSGGEVRITRASRDAGVDAIAFDPDPIRGGKYVIQAKRYNGVVGVSAVRDLYGTMINEGAVKGILVTTSHFGKDSYDFAKDKPIQLIDGPQLLGLLEQQGYGSFNITLGTDKG